MIRNEKIRNKWPYVTTILIVVAVLMFIYRDADITKPLIYQNGDEVGVFYTVKTIKNGWYFSNPQVGGIAGGDTYDYPYSDSMSFAIVKLISLFFSNVYLIGNLFYFSMHILTAITSIYVCRKLKYDNFIAILVSVLYSFSPYIQMRYAHMWLVPYFMMPLACMVAIWILNGEFNNYRKEPWWKNKKYCQALVISFACAFTGLYYAFFTCCIYMIAFVIRFINADIKSRKKELCPLIYILSVIFGIFVQIIPNFLYWIKNGTNGGSEFSVRTAGDAELYGLKLIQLLLPRGGHRLSFLSDLAEKYAVNFPLVNENASSVLGLIASIGLIVSLLWLFDKRQRKSFSYLNISLILIGTIGGIGSIFSLLIGTPMRSYNRISVMIMFISLLCIGTLLEALRKRCSIILFRVVVMLLLVLGIFDQTIDYEPSDIQAINFESTQEFVSNIENLMNKDDMIFQLPYVGWPSGGNYRMFFGYLNSDDLRWSYGCMQGREEAVWQENIAKCELNTMLKALALSGYKGLYLDADIYTNMRGESETQTFVSEVTEYLEESPIISSNGELYYWNMTQYSDHVLKSISDLDKDNILDIIRGAFPVVNYGNGFYAEEKENNDVWHWCDSSGELFFENKSEITLNMKLSLAIWPGVNGESEIIISVNGEEIKYDLSGKGLDVVLPIVAVPGVKNTITFSCDGQPLNIGSNRDLYFQVRNLQLISDDFKDIMSIIVD